MYVSIQFIPILSDGELLVVINRNIDLLGANGFIIRIVELTHIRMLQTLLSCESLVRIEYHQVLQHVQSVITGCWKHISQSFGFGGWKGI